MVLFHTAPRILTLRWHRHIVAMAQIKKAYGYSKTPRICQKKQHLSSCIRQKHAKITPVMGSWGCKKRPTNTPNTINWLSSPGGATPPSPARSGNSATAAELVGEEPSQPLEASAEMSAMQALGQSMAFRRPKRFRGVGRTDLYT